MQQTGNYGLKKPDGTDIVNIVDFNDNADIIDTQLKNLNDNKVTAVAGKGLSTNDYTAAEKTKLAGIATGANNYVHPSTHPASMITEETNKRFMTDAERTKLSGIAAGANNYVHPDKHPASIITQDANNRFVTDAEKVTWNAKETTSGAQVKANTAEANAKQYIDQQLTEHEADDVAHNRYGTATGTNALVITLSPALGALKAGISLRFKNTTANTGAVTLNVNALGAKPVVTNGGALKAGDLKAGGLYTAVYDGTSFILQGEGGSELIVAVGEVVILSADKSVNTNRFDFEKKKEIIVNFTGSVRIKFDLFVQYGGWGRGAIYVNDVLKGTIRETNASVPAVYSETMTIAEGDKVQLYLTGSGGGYASSNFMSICMASNPHGTINLG